MKRFISNTELDLLSHQAAGRGPDAISGEVELIWHLRQRDPGQAMSRIAAARRQIAELALRPFRSSLERRLTLAEGEIAWLNGQLDQARCLAEPLLDEALKDEDYATASDAQWLLVGVHHDAGDVHHRGDSLVQSLQLAEAASDEARRDQASIALAYFELRAGTRQAIPDLASYMLATDVGVRHIATEINGLIAMNSGSVAEGVRCLERALELALDTGQIRRAIGCANNLGGTFEGLNDPVNALRWLERALDMSRPTGWPETHAKSLLNLCAAAVKFGHVDQVEEWLQEAFNVLSPLREFSPHPYIDALLTRAKLRHAKGDHSLAYEDLLQALAAARKRNDDQITWYVLNDLSRSCLQLGDLADAQEHATSALQLAQRQRDPALEIESRVILGEVHVAASLREGRGGSTSSSLQLAASEFAKARALAVSTPTYTFSPSAVVAMAKVAAALKKFELAYTLADEARRLDSADSRNVAARRLLAMEVAHRTDKARQEAEFSKQLAEAEQRRAFALEQANRELRAALEQLEKAQAELQRANAALSDASTTDPLTGLRNRRFLTERIAGDVEECLRSSSGVQRKDSHPPDPGSMGFFLVDMDHFKSVNDAHGHDAGDAILVQLKDRLCSAVRQTDYVIRWGGEEFLVVVRNMIVDEAPTVAERIRQAVRNEPFGWQQRLKLNKTCSVGYCVFTPLDATIDWAAAVALADKALYAAKRDGRDGWVGVQQILGPVEDLLQDQVDLHGAASRRHIRLMTHTAGKAAP